MKRVRCAVIGAGWWGTTAHVPALRDHARADLVAIQHHDAATAERVARDYDVPTACTTAEEVLAIEDLDAVVVSSTPHLHYPQVKAALERGLHVLVEKPMTITADQAQTLVDLAASRDLHLIIGCTYHYTAHAAEAQRIVRDGTLGDIKMVQIVMTDDTVALYKGLSWAEFAGNNPDAEVVADAYLTPGKGSYSDPKISGGGQIYAQISHAAAYVAFLIGDEPASVHAHFDNAGTAVDVYDTLNIRMARGTMVSMASAGSIAGGPREFSITVWGTKGMIKLDLAGGTMSVYAPDTPPRTLPPLGEDGLYLRYDPATNLVDLVLGDAPNRSPGTLGLSAMKIIDAACRSAKTGRNIVI